MADGNGTVEQISHYYPFGALFGEVSGDDEQRNRYNGKELERLLVLDWYDYGARWYDPVLGIWHSIDPMAGKYPSVSPYVYCGNNPMRYIDLKGLAPGDFFLTVDAAAIDNANERQRDSYLVTPNGSLKKYSPATGKVTLISTDMPSDYNDPSRVNNKSSLIETNPIRINIEFLQRLKNQPMVKTDCTCKENPFEVVLRGSDHWALMGSLYPKGAFGGTAHINIQKADCRIICYYHEK